MGKAHGMIGNVIWEKNNRVPNLYKNSGTEIQLYKTTHFIYCYHMACCSVQLIKPLILPQWFRSRSPNE
jgi:hypothetical protein